MRIATANSYDSTIAIINKRQADLSDLQNRISTGKRVLRASDDPVAAVMSEASQNRLSRVESDQRALDRSQTSLTQAESALGQTSDIIQRVRELMVSAGNGSYGPSEFKSIANEIEGLRDQMMSVANQKDSNGRTLFGGLGGSGLPFVEVYGPSSNGVRFDGMRGQEAAGNLSLPQSFDGNAIWMRVPPGNGSFALDLAPGNTGTVRSDVGKVDNPSALTGNNYSVTFSGTAGSMQYSVTNTTTALPVPGKTGVPYTPATRIEFDGLSFEVNGDPQAGDAINVSSPTSPTDMFKVMQDAVAALRGAGVGNNPQLLQSMGRAMTELDAGFDSILQARSLAGAWLNRADAAGSHLADRAVAHKAEKSALEDLDMVQGISDFQNQQTGLQAALQSYAQVQRLSLFQYIS